jgi:hypothetical protein
MSSSAGGAGLLEATHLPVLLHLPELLHVHEVRDSLVVLGGGAVDEIQQIRAAHVHGRRHDIHLHGGCILRPGIPHYVRGIRDGGFIVGLVLVGRRNMVGFLFVHRTTHGILRDKRNADCSLASPLLTHAPNNRYRSDYVRYMESERPLLLTTRPLLSKNTK